MSVPAPKPGGGLLFAWEKPRAFYIWLPGFVALSLLAHAGTFFLFSVVYPERASIPAPPPPITLLNASNPENLALLRWIEAEDPALIALPPKIEPPELLKAAYRPSFQVIRTAPRSVAEADGIPQDPPAREPLLIIRSAPPGTRPAPQPPKLQPTALTFSGGLAGRTVSAKASLSLPKTSAPIESARFLLGADARGQVRFVFPQKSSGDPALDTQAAAHLRRLTFGPSQAELAWGFATFEWGDEVYEGAAPAQPAAFASPAPRP